MKPDIHMLILFAVADRQVSGGPAKETSWGRGNRELEATTDLVRWFIMIYPLVN